LGGRGRLALVSIGAAPRPVQQLGEADFGFSSAPGLALSADGKRALIGKTGSIRLWDLEAGKEVRSFTPFSSSGTHLSLHPKDSRAVSEGPGNTLVSWSLETGKELV